MTQVLPAAGAAPTTRRTLTAGALTVELTAAGDLRRIEFDGLLVNQYLPSSDDTAPLGLWLRLTDERGVRLARIDDSRSRVEISRDRIAWSGHSLGIEHRVELGIHEAEDATGMLVRRIELRGGTQGTTLEVVAAQDLALAPPAAALSSEAYVCQYLLHRSLAMPPQPGHGTPGSALVSRQTMSSLPRLPLHLMFIAEGSASHLTDSLQVATPRTRADGQLHGLLEAAVSGVRQDEYGSPTLISHPLDPSQGAASLHVVQVIRADDRSPLDSHAAHIETWRCHALSLATMPAHGTWEQIEPFDSPLRHVPPFAGDDVPDDALLAALDLTANDVVLPERDENGRLLSFFTSDGAHVLRGVKDTLTERSHGHVLRAGGATMPTDDVLSATVFAPGVFASHVVLGNTTENRLTSVHRHHLNLIRGSGLRVVVGDDNGPQLLGLPTALVLDIGEAHWIYLSRWGRIDVRTTVDAARNRLETTVAAPHDLRVTATLELDDIGGGWCLSASDDDPTTLMLAPASEGEVASHIPTLRYAMRTSGATSLTSTSGPDQAVERLTMQARGALSLTISASLHSEDEAMRRLGERTSMASNLQAHRDQMRGVMRGLRFADHPALPTNELDVLIPWYVHNALVHLLVPHGLEQYSGAAWGTRDVCQGPLELALTGGRFDLARELLLRVFARQFPGGNFPQWFMFDAYRERYNDGAHGDVVVWPLMALGQYLRYTGDRAVLEVPVPFWDAERRAPGLGTAEVLRDHVTRALDYVSTHRLPGTSLPAYEEGDWDDTLQPADDTLRTRMASTWTSALLVQATELLAEALSGDPRSATLRDRTAQLGKRVRESLRARGLANGVMAGYVLHEGEAGDELLMHPRDTRTGMTYRLIPMTRSILAGVLSPREAAAHERLVADHLTFPDGVRLMDRPADFDEGIPRTFLRAEQAASVGREVGLMYTHAHIRWVEALCALGRASALDELMRVSPVALHDRLPHAAPRQRNAYYSSSDAAFPDRYAFSQGFEALRRGEVPVRGGWRIYSSGPGIFLRQLVTGVLGLTERAHELLVDPVLSPSADGLTVHLNLGGHEREVRFRVGEQGTERRVLAGPDAAHAEALPTHATRSAPYRTGGVTVALDDLETHPYLEVHVPAGT